jgi:hypothetical protein
VTVRHPIGHTVRTACGTGADGPGTDVRAVRPGRSARGYGAPAHGRHLVQPVRPDTRVTQALAWPAFVTATIGV